MIKDLITLISGVFIGVVLVILVYCLDVPKREVVNENMSLRPPKELPSNMPHNETNIPNNLQEIIL